MKRIWFSNVIYIYTYIYSFFSFPIGVGAAVIDTYLYVVGGHSGSSYLNTVQKYDPISDNWLDTAGMMYCRCNFGLTALWRIPLRTQVALKMPDLYKAEAVFLQDGRKKRWLNCNANRWTPSKNWILLIGKKWKEGIWNCLSNGDPNCILLLTWNNLSL